MGLEIANNSLQETCFILAIVGVVLAITATVLRFVAVRLANRKPGWEDWFSILATFFFILYVIPLLYRKLLLSFTTFVLIVDWANYAISLVLSIMNGKTTWTITEVVQIKKVYICY
jgi:hypothetical protein